MTREQRLAALSDAIQKHQAARDMTASPVWKEIWDGLEQELLERLLQCGPTDDFERFRRQTAIQVARDLRRIVEAKGITPAELEKELGYLDGSKLRPVA